MAKNPGVLVEFIDHYGVANHGIVYNNEDKVNDKPVVHYVDATTHKVITEILKGTEVPKKRLIDPNRLKVIGYVD